MGNRVVLVGAVHESLSAFDILAAHPAVELAGVVTLTHDAAQKVSGFVDLTGPARNLGIPVLHVSDVNAPEAVAMIRDLAADLIAVVGWTRLIGEDLLTLPRAGCVGFHASLLPYGRGRAPVNWSILRGDPVTGNTMMVLDAGVDTGRIVDQRSTPIYLDDTCASVYQRVGQLGADMLRDNILSLLNGEARPTPQDTSAATEFPKRTPAMGVTDWRSSPLEVHNWIRALTSPYPGAFTTLSGRQVMLWSSAPPMYHDGAGRPGEILEVSSAGLRIAAGDGNVLVTRIGTTHGPADQPTVLADELGLRVGAHFDVPDRETAAWASGLGARPEVTRT